MFLRLVDREVLALQPGANREAHARDHAGRFAELQPEEGLPGGMRRLLHRGGLTGREPSAAIRRPGSGGDAGKSGVKDKASRGRAHWWSDGRPATRRAVLRSPGGRSINWEVLVA